MAEEVNLDQSLVEQQMFQVQEKMTLCEKLFRS